MAPICEGMYLLDNDQVREGWTSAKALVTDILKKNNATVHTARRWDERVLAYPIKRRTRATYLIVYYEVASGDVPNLVRDLDLSEKILRYLFTRVDAVPEGEAELAAAEDSADFQIPVPPEDEVGTYAPLQGMDDDEDDDDEDDSDDQGDDDDEREAPAKPKAARPKPAAVGAAAKTPEASAADDEEDD